MSAQETMPTRREAAHLHAYRLRLSGFVNGVDVSSDLQQSLDEAREQGWDEVVRALRVSEMRILSRYEAVPFDRLSADVFPSADTDGFPALQAQLLLMGVLDRFGKGDTSTFVEDVGQATLLLSRPDPHPIDSVAGLITLANVLRGARLWPLADEAIDGARLLIGSSNAIVPSELTQVLDTFAAQNALLQALQRIECGDEDKARTLLNEIRTQLQPLLASQLSDAWRAQIQAMLLISESLVDDVDNEPATIEPLAEVLRKDRADDLAEMLLRTAPYDSWSSIPVHEGDWGPYPTLLPYVQAMGQRRGGAPETAVIAAHRLHGQALARTSWRSQEAVAGGVAACIDARTAEVEHLRLQDEVVTDSLTGVGNRRAYQRYLDEHEGQEITLVLIDIDDFKGINDVFGHVVGDAVLTAIAEGLADLTPPSGIVCRIGGDEFVALHDGLVGLDSEELQHDIESWVQHRHRLRDIPMLVRPAVTLGVASGLASPRLLIDADRRMYDAKQDVGGSGPTRRMRVESTVDRRQGPRSIELPVAPSLDPVDPVRPGPTAPGSAQDSRDPARERAHEHAYMLAMMAQSDAPMAAESIRELRRLADDQGWPEVVMAARYATCIHDLWHGDLEAPGKIAAFLASAIDAQLPGFEALGRLLEVQISSAQGQVDVFLEQVATITLLLREPGIHLLEEMAGLINQGEEFSALRLWEPQERAARRVDELAREAGFDLVAVTGVAAFNRLEAAFDLAITQIELGQTDTVRESSTRVAALLEDVKRYDLPTSWMIEVHAYQEFLELFIEDRDASPAMLDTAAHLRAHGVESVALLLELMVPVDEWGTDAVMDDGHDTPNFTIRHLVLARALQRAGRPAEHVVAALTRHNQALARRALRMQEVMTAGIAAVIHARGLAAEQQRLWTEAATDPLTSLGNRRCFDQELRHRREQDITLFLIDLDQLKMINDRFGHAVGDAVLRHVAAVLADLADGGGVATRIGGDEFAVLLEPMDEDDATAIVARLSNRIMEEVPVTLTPGVRPKASIGVARGPCSEELLRTADARLYEVKGAA